MNNTYPDLVAGVAVVDNKIFVMENIKQSDPVLNYKNELQHPPTRLETPGGKIDGDESYEHALKREYKEEFGVDITVGEYLGSIPTTIPNGVTLNVHTFYIDIAGTPKNQEPHKCGRFGYFTLDELQEMHGDTTVLTPNLATVLQILKESGQMT